MTALAAHPPESDIDVFSDEVLADPYPAYRSLRDAGPAVRLTSHPAWVIARYDNVRAALADWRSFSSADSVALTDEGNANMRGSVLASDPPEHDVLRGVLSEQLAPRALAKLRGDINERADALVSEVVARGDFDAVTDLCERLPVDVVADLIGLPTEGRERLLPGAEASFASLGPFDQRMQARVPALRDYLQYMQSFDAPCKLAPDSWGAAVWEAVAVGRIAAESAVPLLMAYLVAGMDTTVHGLGAYIRILAEDPDLWASLKADPGLVLGGFDEALRLESPVQGFFRNTTRDVDVDGVLVPAGSRVLLSYASGNRDERHYPDPDRYDLHRNPVDHLAFGYATHGCVGQGLARIEAQALISSLLRRADRIELVGTPTRHTNPITRGLNHVPVHVVPTRKM